MGNESNRLIFAAARVYLLSFDKVDNNMIDNHLNLWKEGKRDSINDLLFRILDSVRNKQGMPKTIGELENLRPYLEDFSPSRIIEKYDNDWRKLFKTIQGNYTPPGRMVIDVPKSYWVIFCKAVISASNFLSRFPHVGEFNEFVSQFYLNEYTRVALPMLLGKEIFGLGFALACDFLKESGYPKFVKPDTHIKAIFNGIGISRSEDDYEIFKDVIRFSESIDEIPYVVDKLFWLVGSGNFYLIKEVDEKKYEEIKREISAKRDDFIKKVIKEVGFQEK